MHYIYVVVSILILIFSAALEGSEKDAFNYKVSEIGESSEPVKVEFYNLYEGDEDLKSVPVSQLFDESIKGEGENWKFNERLARHFYLKAAHTSATYFDITNDTDADRELSLYYSTFAMMNFRMVVIDKKTAKVVQDDFRSTKGENRVNTPYFSPSILVKKGDNFRVILTTRASQHQYRVYISTPEKMNSFTTAQTYYFMLPFGIIFGVLVYNIVMLVKLRTKDYLYYVIYLVFLALLNGTMLGYDAVAGLAQMISKITGDHSTYIVHALFNLYGLIGASFVMIFMVEFIELKKKYPKLSLAIKGLSLLPVVASLSVIVGNSLAGDYYAARMAAIAITLKISPLLLLAGVVTPLYFWVVQRNRNAMFLFFSISALMIGNGFYFSFLLWGAEETVLTRYGSLFGGAFEVLLLAAALSDKYKRKEQSQQVKISALNNDLKEINEGLEEKVEEKTRDVKSMMANMSQGMFMLVGEDLTCHHEYSSRLEKILSSKDLAGLKVEELLFDKLDLSADLRSQAITSLKAAIGEDEINFLANSHTLPREVKSTDGKILSLSWEPICNDLDEVDKFLVTISDVTAQKKAEEKAKERELEMSRIHAIFTRGRDRIENFLKGSSYLIEDLDAAIEAEDNLGAFGALHTLKGNARTLGLKDLSDLAHEIEDGVSAGFSASKTREGSRKLKDILDAYATILEKMGATSAKVEDNFLAADIVAEALEGLEDVAKELGKEVPNIKINAEKLSFNHREKESIAGAIGHLWRNSMDHGLETSEERLEKGKTAEGTIQIDIATIDDKIVIKFKDDGRGLDLVKIKGIGVKKGLIAEDVDCPETVSNLIMAPGFSSKSEVTDISGRGIGLDAVKTSLERNGGSLKLSIYDQVANSRSPVKAEFELMLPSKM